MDFIMLIIMSRACFLFAGRLDPINFLLVHSDWLMLKFSVNLADY